MKEDVLIDLADYRTAGALVYTGRDRGEEVRKKSRVDELAESADHVIVRIPEDTFSINPSFLEEFFRNIVKKMGASAFWQKFSFDNKGEYQVKDNLQLAIERILRKSSALSR
ncbi:DUF4325 domain-containing protein [Hymenobacter metallicola]|uniref:DUF4325 domain-containing protein n=1 Tax=Hymenobacter metallicola TaxID=2563114 RepID=A0A4Z0QA75_9BACT|nr:DUF4325 domain-containing protein [Hymenobacter metallicola]TGE26920.1 DUF4325 domain-containing protein [Hymenobacter metallicola]